MALGVEGQTASSLDGTLTALNHMMAALTLASRSPSTKGSIASSSGSCSGSTSGFGGSSSSGGRNFQNASISGRGLQSGGSLNGQGLFQQSSNGRSRGSTGANAGGGVAVPSVCEMFAEFYVKYQEEMASEAAAASGRDYKTLPPR